MDAPRILVVEDEPVVVEVVERYLRRDGYQVEVATDGLAALDAFARLRPHLVVLDLMLPRLGGMEVCQRIRASGGSTPILMLTARGDEIDRIAGFEVGADDYMAKPFSPRELVMRVKAILRRSFDGDVAPPSGPIESGGIVVDPRGRSVTVEGRPVTLTNRELDLLVFLIRNPGVAFSRQQILERVWDFEWFGDVNTVTVHIRRLRTKVEADPEDPKHIATVWGLGYRWDP